MQELSIYHAMFSDLSDQEFAEIVGREAQKRGRMCVFYLFALKPGDMGSFTSVLPSEWNSKPAAQQLIIAATIAAEATDHFVKRVKPYESGG